ncbi:ComF family protein [Candidatus Albibeggiatoa sp. nov. BB20]|uniref:ComF family protein n=1 Tax=Candidatus Albibeggiatoa sp. nov. BB20 TaxID=3162723 RepID=UPI00336585D8
MDISIQSARAFKHVHHAYAVFDYVYPVNRLIQSAKFYNNLVVLHYLGSLMAQHLDFEQIPDVIIPVPLHIKRLRQRGYNQSVELAKMVRNKLKLPLNYSHCQRIRYTVPQVGLNGKARLTNLADAFAIKQWPTEWEHVLLIDDVLTTGTTVDEISKVLKSVGVKQITVWCCAARFTNE